MKTKAKIVRLFLEDTKPKTIREISHALHIDYRLTYIAIQRLIVENVIQAQTVGKSSLCSLNSFYYGLEIYRAENERKEQVLKNKDLRQICTEIFSKVNTSFFILLLFGSYAKGTAAQHSDFDLMFVSNEKDFEERVSTIVSLIPLKTHTLVFKEGDFIRMKNARKSNVVHEAIEHNIVLYGIEAYYKIKNAG